MHVDRRHRHADLRRKRVGDGLAHVLGNLDEAVTVIRLDGNGDGDLLVALRLDAHAIGWNGVAGDEGRLDGRDGTTHPHGGDTGHLGRGERDDGLDDAGRDGDAVNRVPLIDFLHSCPPFVSDSMKSV